MDRLFRIGIYIGFFLAFSVEALLALIVFIALTWEGLKAKFKKV